MNSKSPKNPPGFCCHRDYPTSEFNVSSASGGNTRSAAARFSRRCATDEVPGIKRIFGERCSSHASATCIGVAPSESATACSPEDCSGVKPPSGKNGTRQSPAAPANRPAHRHRDSQRCTCSVHTPRKPSSALQRPAKR